MKTCTKCQKEKDQSEFYNQKDRKNGYSFCKSCFNQYCMKRWIDRKVAAINSKGGKCADCKLTLEDSHYAIFEFHHIDPSTKDVDWTKLRLKSQDKIDKELEKCVCLCANCHRMRHVEMVDLSRIELESTV